MKGLTKNKMIKLNKTYVNVFIFFKQLITKSVNYK